MNHSLLRRALALGLASACLLPAALAGGVRAAGPPVPAKKTPLPVEALVYTTMPSVAAHRPEMAMDGDAGTYFKSAYGMGDGDDFLVLLSRPIPVRSLRITTGDAGGQDLLTGGTVETSSDGAHFHKAASFNSAGVADAPLNGTPVTALRIRLNHGQGLPSLLVREITIQSPVSVAHVMRGPGRGFYDISQAPDLTVWARTAETQMEEFWPDTEALLYSDKFIPPNMVNVVYRTGPGVTGVAATGGGVMEVNSAWCRAHPEDTGLTVHETAHVIQAYSAYNPVWLVEGIADYIRWVRFEPEHFTYRINPQTATYHDAYRTTAAFLAWCELHYDSGLVTKLSRAVRFGTFSTGLFKQYCGKDVDTLWSEFLAAYQADPKGVITPPVALADRPRPLPAVTPGSNVPVDLSAAFTTVGIFNDGVAATGTGGVDGEGNGYSAPASRRGSDCERRRIPSRPGQRPRPHLLPRPDHPAAGRSPRLAVAAGDGGGGQPDGADLHCHRHRRHDAGPRPEPQRLVPARRLPRREPRREDALPADGPGGEGPPHVLRLPLRLHAGPNEDRPERHAAQQRERENPRPQPGELAGGMTESAYDALAPFYHLLFPDWDVSMARQAAALDGIIRQRWGAGVRTVLDAACGIGTQALGLAARGYQVTASDLSQAEVERARREAALRGLSLDFAVADMRAAFAAHGRRQFDLVVACDNSVPHLLTDDDLRQAFGQFHACLRPGGGCLLTVRDYDQEERGGVQITPAAFRVDPDGVRRLVFQVWEFDGPHYDFTLYLIEDRVGTEAVTHTLRSRYYAVGADRLLSLMAEAGFEDVARLDGVFYQPVLVGTKS